MKAALCKSLDGPDAIAIENVPEPVAKAGEAVVRVKAAALNFFDTLVVRGKYQYKPEIPFAIASEFAGMVESVAAGVTQVKPGDRVFGIVPVSQGATREKIAVPVLGLHKTPSGVSDETACGIVVTYGTGYYGLKDRGLLQPGESIAVLGASGGAGLAAVELAKIMGARVIACASSAEKLKVCKDHGADVLINYNEATWRDALKEATGGKGVDLVYDCVGGPYAEPAIRTMAWGGRFLVIGFAAGDIPRPPLNLLLLKSCSLVGVFWGEAVRRDPEGNARNMAQVVKWVAEGKLKPHVHKTFPLERTADAIKELDRRASTGKVVITL